MSSEGQNPPSGGTSVQSPATDAQKKLRRIEEKVAAYYGYEPEYIDIAFTDVEDAPDDILKDASESVDALNKVNSVLREWRGDYDY